VILIAVGIAVLVVWYVLVAIGCVISCRSRATYQNPFLQRNLFLLCVYVHVIMSCVCLIAGQHVKPDDVQQEDTYNGVTGQSSANKKPAAMQSAVFESARDLHVDDAHDVSPMDVVVVVLMMLMMMLMLFGVFNRSLPHM
jgi:hypothetical protein